MKAQSLLMIRGARLLEIVLLPVSLALTLVASIPKSYALLGDCAQPVTNGTLPTASDCLFVLRAAVASEQCVPECVCAPKGTLPPTATDALMCLKAAVGAPVTLECPCQNPSLIPYCCIQFDAFLLWCGVADETECAPDDTACYDSFRAGCDGIGGMVDSLLPGQIRAEHCCLGIFPSCNY